jgi:hypothetical protein
MNRFVFNSKLNREKFEINKKKIFKKDKNYQMIRVHNYHTFHPYNDNNDNNDNKPPDWKLFLIAAFGFYTINRFKK